MTYIIKETVNTVPWSEGVTNAPADLVKAAKELAESGLAAVFGKIDSDSERAYVWCLLSIGPTGTVRIAKRSNDWIPLPVT